jgi:hypothetical protein
MLLDIELAPGVVKRQGPRAAKNRYDDANWLRFIAGKPEKIGGWVRYSDAAVRGIPRGLISWNDISSMTHLATGTEYKLYWYSGTTPVDITPFQNPAGTQITNKISTTINSSTVTISLQSHGLLPGQGVSIYPVVSIGGLSLYESGYVAQVVDPNTFTIDAGALATSTVPNGGGIITLYFDIVPGAVNPAGGYGWGVGGWGQGTWGTPRTSTSVILRNTVWALDHFGEILLANRSDFGLYQFDPTVEPTPHASLIPTAPGAMLSMFVTQERFVFALGCSSDTGTTIDPMLVSWASQNTIDQWTPDITNTARSRRLQNGKRIVGGVSVGAGVSLVWTDSACYIFQYTGSSLVYNSRLTGTGCGLAGGLSFAVANSVAFWFSINGFFMWNGSTVPIPGADAIKEWVLLQLRQNYETKCVALYNARYDEVWFLFVEGDNTEPSFYAAVKLNEWHWITGTLSRTCGTRIDSSDNHPLMAAADGYLYTHETGYDANGAALPYFLRTTIFGLGDSKQEWNVSGFMPDWDHFQGPAYVTIETWDRTGSDAEPDAVTDTPIIYDTQTVSVNNNDGLLDFRVSGRYARMTIEGNSIGCDMRLGIPQIEYQPSGGRR